MTTTEENLRAFLLADTSVAGAASGGVHYNHVPQRKDDPFVFFQQSGATDDAAMDDSPGTPTRPQYAVECIAAKPLDAVNLKNYVQTRLHKYKGTFGATTVKGIFAEDVDDNYVPNGAGDDEGLHVAALTAEVVL